MNTKNKKSDKITIVIDKQDLIKHIENVVVINENNEEVWKDMIDLDYLKNFIKK